MSVIWSVDFQKKVCFLEGLKYFDSELKCFSASYLDYIEVENELYTRYQIDILKDFKFFVPSEYKEWDKYNRFPYTDRGSSIYGKEYVVEDMNIYTLEEYLSNYPQNYKSYIKEHKKFGSRCENPHITLAESLLEGMGFETFRGNRNDFDRNNIIKIGGISYTKVCEYGKYNALGVSIKETIRK